MKTPGVYIEEVTKLPASVVGVATAVPAFIGFTQTGFPDPTEPIEPVRITSMLDYEKQFGKGPSPSSINVDISSTTYKLVDFDINPDYYLYDSLRMYFANGGGPCYVASIGGYPTTVLTHGQVVDQFLRGLAAVRLEDEPTLLVFPDAAALPAERLGEVQKAALAQCNSLQDRFTILDTAEDRETPEANWESAIDDFRLRIGTQYLKYGAAYTPWLRTGFAFEPVFSHLNFRLIDGVGATTASSLQAILGLRNESTSVLSELNETLADLHGNSSGHTGWDTLTAAIYSFDTTTTPVSVSNTGNQTYLELFDQELNSNLTVDTLRRWAALIKDIAIRMFQLGSNLNNDAIDNAILKRAQAGAKLNEIIATLMRYQNGYTFTPPIGVLQPTHFNGMDHPISFGTGSPFDYELDSPALTGIDIYGSGNAAERITQAAPFLRSLLQQALDIVQDVHVVAEATVEELALRLETSNQFYGGIISQIRAVGSVIPPSGAIAGVYAAVDRARGVWKAPANVSLSGVASPTVKITHLDQEQLNVNPNGKSINAIRTFAGKGHLVWGARTLAGNDNEWRFIPVRRLFITVEESIKKATEFVVFEPNNANTWLRVSTMIENYLTGLWREGALAGAKAEDAFFVKVGLGSTMTQQDILEGKLIIEIGLAAVRPAEFIILKFMHHVASS